MLKKLDNPFYYLENFHRVLGWISERYSDLLTADECAWIAHFQILPQPSQALLARMVMRKGPLFRSGKLVYDEIGCTHAAALPLIAAGWVDDTPLLTIEQLFSLLNKQELAPLFSAANASGNARKAELLDALRAAYPDPHPLTGWQLAGTECIYQLQPQVIALCNRLRLMFFGNLRQDWTEFVLAELGIYQYETVVFSAESRGFQCRDDVDAYLHLHQCRERFYAGEAPGQIVHEIAAPVLNNDWLASRRARLLYEIAQWHEKNDELPEALALYRACVYPGARMRSMRVLERMDDAQAAYELAEQARQAPESDAEQQQLARMLPRLRRKLGHSKMLPLVAPPAIDELTLVLPRPATEMSVEYVVCGHLGHADAPVLYVENALINSLFGLLCWDALFAAVPGAFFHPFHTGPADLHSADFYQRRQARFAACLAQLESGMYQETIRSHYRAKAGLQSPFVFWGALTDELLELALACIPAAHLQHWFARILQDLKANRNGFPDLIQFWPQEKRYRMIEVKGPGDKLQDNQVRLLTFCQAHQIPVTVCYVQWAEAPQ